jgi:hypothetical protein
MNGLVAILQLRPILSHQTRRLPNRSINKTEFHSLRKQQISAISEIRALANCLSRAIDGHPRHAWRIQP